MKNIVYIVLILFSIFSCKTTVKQKLPSSVKHSEVINIYDPTEYEILKLNSLKGLSYSTTYSMLHGQYDSIQKDSIRFAIAKFSQSKVKLEIPEIETLNDSVFLRKTYNEILFNTTLVKWHNKTSNIKNLLIKDSLPKQLFIEIRNYPNAKNNQNTSISFLIFDNKNHSLLYYDTFKYNCDIRDIEKLNKVLGYGLKKLIKNFE